MCCQIVKTVGFRDGGQGAFVAKNGKAKDIKRFRDDLCEIGWLRAPSVCEKKISRQNETVMATDPIDCLPLRELYNAFYYGQETKESSFVLMSTHTRMVRASASRIFGKVVF